MARLLTITGFGRTRPARLRECCPRHGVVAGYRRPKTGPLFVESRSTVNSIRSMYGCPPGGFRSLPDAQDACGPLTPLRLDVRRPAARLGSSAFIAATHGRAMASPDMMDGRVPRYSPCGPPAAIVMAVSCGHISRPTLHFGEVQ